MVASKVVYIKSAMERRLEDLNMRSVLADEENADKRLSVEIAIRRCDGVDEVRYWRIDEVEHCIVEFRRSLKAWVSDYPTYQEHVRVITSLERATRLVEAPLQLSTSLNAWLESHWNLRGARLTQSPGRDFLLRSYRAKL
jgi:hypothetical protein